MDNQLQSAKDAIQRGDMQTAQAFAADLLKKDPQNGEAWFLLSEATAGERKLVFLQKAVDLAPDLEAAQARLAQLEGRPWPEAEVEPVLQPVETSLYEEDDSLMPEEYVSYVETKPAPELREVLEKDFADEDDDFQPEPLDKDEVVVDPAPSPTIQKKTPVSELEEVKSSSPIDTNLILILIIALLALLIFIQFIRALQAAF